MGEEAYVEWAPPPVLHGVAVCLWRRRAAEGSRPVLVLPDGCVDLIWQSGRGTYLAGPDTGPMRTSLPAGHTLVGVRLRPGTGGPLLGVPLAPLRNLRIGLSDLRPDADRVPGTLDPANALRRLVTVTGELSDQRPADPAVLAAVRLLRNPRTHVQDLGSQLDVGDRQLRRRFHAAVGYGPKTLQRVLRFRRFLPLFEQQVRLPA